MKKKFLALLCALTLVLAGCSFSGAPETPEVPEEPEVNTVDVTVFVPNDTAEALLPTVTAIEPPESAEAVPQALIGALIAQGVLPEDVVVQNFADAEGELALDLNTAYSEHLSQSGSAGEAVMLYAVVNTFLHHYEDSISLLLTVDGQAIETGHNLYDEPFTTLALVTTE